MTNDITTGNVFKTIVKFSVPFLLSYLLQTLYGMADLFIIGQFGDVSSTTAVSIGSQVMHMITVMLVGLATGGMVLIGRFVGAEDRKNANKTIGNTILLFSALSLVLLVSMLLLTSNIVSLVSTPTQAVSKTYDYLFVCFAGIPFIIAYNVISSIFRGMGDSKSPMYFIAVACVANIILDYIFIGILKLDSLGAALGTALSQTLSVVISVIVIKKKKLIPDLSKNDFKFSKKLTSGILKIGLPLFFQEGFIQLSFIAITVFANQRGLNDAAAVGIVEKLIGILFLIPSTMMSTVSALCAHNVGANKHNRATEVLRDAILIIIGFGLIISLIMQFFGKEAVYLFTDSDTVARMGNEYIKGYIWDSILAGIHFCFSGYFSAYGRSGISFLHNAISIITARIPIAYYAAKYCLDSLFPMGLAAPIGSFISIIVCLIAYFYLKKKRGCF